MRHILCLQDDLVEMAHYAAEDTGVKCMAADGSLYISHSSLKVLTEVHLLLTVEISRSGLFTERQMRPAQRNEEPYWKNQLGDYMRGYIIPPTIEERQERYDGSWSDQVAGFTTQH